MFSVAGEDTSHGGPTPRAFVVYRHGWCLHQPSIKANGMFSVAGEDTSHGGPTLQVYEVYRHGWCLHQPLKIFKLETIFPIPTVGHNCRLCIRAYFRLIFHRSG